MNFARKLVDLSYDALNPLVFRLTRENPKIAYGAFIHFAQSVHKLGLERFLFDNSANNKLGAFQISTAAGFNKNGDIPSSFLKSLGFDRSVIGTVTADPWKDNGLGLPGIGVDKVAENLKKYNQKFGINEIPMTANLMSTPGKQDEETLENIRRTLCTLRDFAYIDRWEPNFYCLNTRTMTAILDVINEEKIEGQQVYARVSSDLSPRDIERTFGILIEKRVNGIVVADANFNDACYTTESPEKGGASGNTVYERATRMQRAFADLIFKSESSMEIIACGGIDSLARAQERTAPDMKCLEIQIYTPLIFRGPRLLRELKIGC